MNSVNTQIITSNSKAANSAEYSIHNQHADIRNNEYAEPMDSSNCEQAQIVAYLVQDRNKSVTLHHSIGLRVDPVALATSELNHL